MKPRITLIFTDSFFVKKLFNDKNIYYIDNVEYVIVKDCIFRQTICVYPWYPWFRNRS